jgi:hypothetical protein
MIKILRGLTELFFDYCNNKNYREGDLECLIREVNRVWGRGWSEEDMVSLFALTNLLTPEERECIFKIIIKCPNKIALHHIRNIVLQYISAG